MIYVIELAKKFWDFIACYKYITGILFLPCMYHILQYLLMLNFAAVLLCWTMCGMVDFSTLLSCFTVLWLYGSQHNMTVTPTSKQTGMLMLTSLMAHEKFLTQILILHGKALLVLRRSSGRQSKSEPPGYYEYSEQITPSLEP